MVHDGHHCCRLYCRVVQLSSTGPCLKVCSVQSIDSGSLSFLCNIMTQQLTKAYQVITGQADPHGVSLTEEYTQHSLPTEADLQLAGLASQPSLEPDDDFMLPGAHLSCQAKGWASSRWASSISQNRSIINSWQ